MRIHQGVRHSPSFPLSPRSFVHSFTPSQAFICVDLASEPGIFCCPRHLWQNLGHASSLSAVSRAQEQTLPQLCCLQSLTAASSCLMPYLCPQSSGPSRQADRQTTELHSPACSLPSASPLRLFGSTDGAHWLPSCLLCNLASLVLASQWSSPPSGGRRGMIWIPPVPLHIPGTLTCL